MAYRAVEGAPSGIGDEVFWTSHSSTERSAAAFDDACAGVEAALREAGQPSAPDLLVLFLSPHHHDAAAALLSDLGRRWPDATVIGCTAAGVIGGGRELEQCRALSLTAAVLPDVERRVLHVGGPGSPAADAPPDVWRALAGIEPELAPCFVVLADPFSTDAVGLVDKLDAAWPGCPKVGGLASGGSAPGSHQLFHDERVLPGGALVLGLWGDIELTPVVAQGVHPMGEPRRISRADRNFVLELDGRPAVEGFRKFLLSLSDRDRQRFREGPVVGLALPDADRPPGPHDWLVRNLLGLDPEHGVLAVGGQVHGGQLLRFMVRDADAASTDLTGLLRLHAHYRPDPPAGALLFSCLGRGHGFFDEPDHDTRLVQQALGDVAVGGFFCNGELGPVQGRTCVHGYTASIGLFRPRVWD